MKHLATIQTEFLKEAKWDDLSYEAQKEYLKKHRKSKKKITAKPNENGTANLNINNMIAKTLKLKPEGSTRVSLENLNKIIDAGFNIDRATLHLDREKGSCRLHTEWTGESKDNYDLFFVHEFLGFMAGYGGEGPRGLVEFCKNTNITDWTEDKIMDKEIKSGVYSIYK